MNFLYSFIIELVLICLKLPDRRFPYARLCSAYLFLLSFSPLLLLSRSTRSTSIGHFFHIIFSHLFVSSPSLIFLSVYFFPRLLFSSPLLFLLLLQINKPLSFTLFLTQFGRASTSRELNTKNTRENQLLLPYLVITWRLTSEGGRLALPIEARHVYWSLSDGRLLGRRGSPGSLMALVEMSLAGGRRRLM